MVFVQVFRCLPLFFCSFLVLENSVLDLAVVAAPPPIHVSDSFVRVESVIFYKTTKLEEAKITLSYQKSTFNTDEVYYDGRMYDQSQNPDILLTVRFNLRNDLYSTAANPEKNISIIVDHTSVQIYKNILGVGPVQSKWSFLKDYVMDWSAMTPMYEEFSIVIPLNVLKKISDAKTFEIKIFGDTYPCSIQVVRDFITSTQQAIITPFQQAPTRNSPFRN
jgi:hypothetical protein